MPTTCAPGDSQRPKRIESVALVAATTMSQSRTACSALSTGSANEAEFGGHFVCEAAPIVDRGENTLSFRMPGLTATSASTWAAACLPEPRIPKSGNPSWRDTSPRPPWLRRRAVPRRRDRARCRGVRWWPRPTPGRNRRNRRETQAAPAVRTGLAICAASTRTAITSWLGTIPAIKFSIDQRFSSLSGSGLWMRRRGQVLRRRIAIRCLDQLDGLSHRHQAAGMLGCQHQCCCGHCLFDRDARFLGQLAPAIELAFDIGGEFFRRAAKGLGAEIDQEFASLRARRARRASRC